jgi:hypothetical protein
MIRLFPTQTNRKQLSLKQFALVFFICASAATWIGISTIQADDVDPGEYVGNTEVDFQNAAQEQHAKNIAIRAVLQNTELMNEISSAKRDGDEAARTQFKEAVAAYMQEISEKRAEGEGWGNIAKDYGVHPKYLGLGHFKKNQEHAGQYYSSQNKDGGLALGHSKDKAGGYGVSNGHGNGVGNGGGHGRGKK